MAETKEINLFLNFYKDTPKTVLDNLNLLFSEGVSSLTSGYRNPCGKPVLDFYLDPDRPDDFHTSDGTYYLRYCNCIKDYDNEFEAWISGLAPYIIQINGHHVGSIFYDCKQAYFLICVVDNEVVYVPVKEAQHD